MDSLFPVIFLGVALLIALVPLAMIVKVVVRVHWIRLALNGPHRAEARCVRIYTTHSTSHHDGHSYRSSSRHYVFEFTAEDGRPVRFEDADAPSTTLEGDYVSVAYVPGRPEKATLVRGAGERTPYVRAALTVVPLALFVAFAVGLGVEGFASINDFGPGF
jgi:hypothetical protein